MMQDQRGDIVSAMIEEVRQVLGGTIVSAEAEKALEEKLRLDWGGQAVYVKKVAVDVEARARDIRTRYNMVNRRELQAYWNISRGQFYKILRGG
jgi:Mor family transcriptional regulator